MDGSPGRLSGWRWRSRRWLRPRSAFSVLETSVRRPERLGGLPRRGRRDRDRGGAPGRDRRVRRRRSCSTTSSSSIPLLHVHRPRPGRVAERGPAALRRHRGRPARRAAAIAHAGGAGARARGPRALPRQPRARDARLDRRRAARPSRDLLRDETRMERVWIALGDDAPASGSRPTRAAGSRPTAAGRTSTSCAGCPATSRRSGCASTADQSRAARASAGHRGVPRADRGAPARARLDLGAHGRASAASPTAPRRGCWRPRPTRSARRSPRTGSPPRPRPPRSRARATSSSRRCCSRCRTTCARRWRRSAPRPARCDPGSGLSPRTRRRACEAIDREVEYLNRLVTNLLDLSRIEAGALRAERDVFELDDLVGRTLERLRPRLGGRPLEVELRRAAGRGRSDLPRRGGHQRPRERDQVHAGRHARSAYRRGRCRTSRSCG